MTYAAHGQVNLEQGGVCLFDFRNGFVLAALVKLASPVVDSAMGKSMADRIWVVDHKASLGARSPFNLDGSSWILGVCVLLATDQQSAMSKFNDYLKGADMNLQEIYEIGEFEAKDYKDGSRRAVQILDAARSVSTDTETCYVFARTSEYMKSLEADCSPLDKFLRVSRRAILDSVPSDKRRAVLNFL